MSLAAITRHAILACLSFATPFTGSASGAEVASFAYRVERASGTTTTTSEGLTAGNGTGPFTVILEPVESGTWDLGAVSKLGIGFRNAGPSQLVIDVEVENADATDWSGSANGRVVVEPGESLPLIIALPRPRPENASHPAFLRMAGLPDGTIHLWRNLDASRVTRIEIRSRVEGAHGFVLGDLFAAEPIRPALMERFPLVDVYGQLVHRDWPGKVRSDEDLRRSIGEETEWAASLPPAPKRGRFGGWLEGPKLEATGRFRVEQVDGRWWFVDPEGLLFWSHGATGVGLAASRTVTRRDSRVFAWLPDVDDPVFGEFHGGGGSGRPPRGEPSFDFGLANLRRKHGEGWRARAIDRELLRFARSGMNTLGAWSPEEMLASPRMPYTAILHFGGAPAAEKLPDPFDPRSRQALRNALQANPALKDDPWCVGVFINNELHWARNARALVVSILKHGKRPTEAKRTFLARLRERHADIDAFNRAWGVALASWDDLLGGLEGVDLGKADMSDCTDLATLFADRYFAMVAEELDAFAPGVLDLGCRFHIENPEVIRAAARHVDVISVNHYVYEPGLGAFTDHGRPIVIGEFHFADLGRGLLGSGLRSAQDATQQARLYRHYLDRVRANPSVVGAHWFAWRDQAVTGRPDGENYGIGFVDIADIPRRELTEASAAFSATLY